MTPEPPDFRKLTATDIREGISTLNKFLKAARPAHKSHRRDFYWATGMSIVGGGATIFIFPPAVFFVAALGGLNIGQSGARFSMTSQAVEQAQEMRARLKTLYRARPGRKQFNLAARREREAARKGKRTRPGPPGWK